MRPVCRSILIPRPGLRSSGWPMAVVSTRARKISCPRWRWLKVPEKTTSPRLAGRRTSPMRWREKRIWSVLKIMVLLGQKLKGIGGS